MSTIGIITGSIRPGRQSRKVADWVASLAQGRGDADYRVVDIADYHLPVWDEARPPRMGQYEHQVTKDWAAAIGELDGFVFVAPEYNHSISGALKNALDYLLAEYTNKAAGFVSYGSLGGARAVEHLRGILSELQVAHVRNQVALSFAVDFRNYKDLVPSQGAVAAVHAMLDQLIPWTKAMELVRSGSLVPGPASA